MRDTAWIRCRILRDYGSLDAFAAALRAQGHRLITGAVLDTLLAGQADAWNEEAGAIARLLGVGLPDVLASLCLASIEHRFAFPADADAECELV